MTITAPTAPYRPVAPNARDAAPYIPWLIDRAVRLGRDNGYANLVDVGLEMLLRDLGVRTPVGGFVDSDGRNAKGVRGGYDPATGLDADGYNRQGFDKDGFNKDGVNAAGQTREEVIETMVEGWDGETAAVVLNLLADRLAALADAA
jgi:hypothetical protein